MATAYTPGPGMGHSAHPGWSLTPAEGPGEFRTLELLPGRAVGSFPPASPSPLIFQARAWRAPCGLSQGRPRVPWLRLGGESAHVSLGFVLGSPPVCGRTCFTPPSVLLRWSRVTEGSSVVFSEPLDFPACLGLMSLVHRGLLFRLFKHSRVNCDSFGRSLFSVSVTNAGSPFPL